MPRALWPLRCPPILLALSQHRHRFSWIVQGTRRTPAWWLFRLSDKWAAARQAHYWVCMIRTQTLWLPAVCMKVKGITLNETNRKHQFWVAKAPHLGLWHKFRQWCTPKDQTTVLCCQEQVCDRNKAPSEDAEMLYDKRILTKNFNGLPYSFRSLVTWSLLGTSFFCYFDKAQQL